MTSCDDLVGAIRNRYASSGRAEKTRILDEFAAVTGFHRKHAMRLLRSDLTDSAGGARRERRLYGDAVRAALVVIWEASDRICGKRLRPLIPMLLGAMERHGHLQLDVEVRRQLLRMSAATLDRALRAVKTAGRKNRHRGVASTALRRSIPIRTFGDWGDPPPGFFEADLVSHSGPVASGSFTQTLVVTDIATGWTECAPLLVREQTLLAAVLTELRRLMPVPMRGLDTDNDSVFINATLRDYCVSADIEFTRCRPYRKNDQAWIEQKNGAIVRKIVGYRRLEGPVAAAALAELYAAVRLFVNFFQPSFKLAAKHRDGAQVYKRYHPPATPHRRMMDHPETPDDVKQNLQALADTLDPVRLLRDIRAAQQRLVEIADHTQTGTAPPSLEAFLSGLRTAWRAGEVRPTAQRTVQLRRGRRRPDPLVAATTQLKLWFDSEPWRTARELLELLQADQPGRYPDELLRTVQRRLKIWRSERAREMVFGQSAANQQTPIPAEEIAQ